MARSTRETVASPTGLIRTLPALLERRATESPDEYAIITTDRRISFAQLRSEVRRAAAALIDRGVAPGDRVAIWMPNSWHWVVAGLAVHYAGAVLVPVNTRFTATEAEDILARVSAPLVIAATEFAGCDRLAELNRTSLSALRQIVRVDVRTGCGWPEFVTPSTAALFEVDIRLAGVNPDDVSDIFFTSGTTGRSKGVPCSHGQSLSATAAVWQATGGLTADDRYLCVNPFFHTFGYRFGIVACLQAGATLIPEAVFDPEKALATMSEQRVTVFTGPPIIHQVLLDHPARRSHDLTSWRLAVTGSTTLPVALIERMQRDLDVVVVTGYGLTEVSGYGTTCGPSDDPVTVATTCGRPIPGLELRINASDENGAGEVLLRGPHVMRGYLDDPEATRSAIDPDGWFHTGDLGTVDGDGNLRITGRIKDVYICAGFNVDPAEVENVLARLEGVGEIAVIGVGDPRLGEVGRAFVVPRPGAAIDERTIIAYAREHLADFKVPRSVVFVSGLPRNAGGKVLKRELRAGADPAGAAASCRWAPVGAGGPPRGTVENWIADIWQDVLGIGRPGRMDRFTDLGGDSLAALDMCRILSLQFGARISLDGFAARQTIAELVGDLRPGSGAERSPVVSLRDDGAGPVYLMIPGLGGHAWNYLRLSTSLRGPCDVLSLSLIDVRRGVRGAIRDAALRVLTGPAAAGRPITVVGYSFGALIAADLACWLNAQGVSVGDLFLVDPKPVRSDAAGWASAGAEVRIAVRSARRLRNSLLRRTPWRSEAIRRSRFVHELEDETAAVSGYLVNAYMDGSIRLPDARVACVRSRELMAEGGAAATIFSTPAEALHTLVLDADHLDVLRRRDCVTRIADWLDRSAQPLIAPDPSGPGP